MTVPLSNPTPEQLMVAIVREFDKRDLVWCVIGDYRKFPNEVTTDLDILMEPGGFEQAAAVIGQIGRGRIVQHKRYSRRAASWTFANRDADGKIRFAGIDILAETPFSDIGIPISAPDDLLATRVVSGNDLWVLPHETEFLLCFAKRLAKIPRLAPDVAFDDVRTDYLSNIYRRASEACRNLLSQYVAPSDAEMIRRAAESGDWADVRADARRLRKAFRRQALKTMPLALLAARLNKLKRWPPRIRNPNGLFIALLGTDGSGKTLLQQNLADGLAPLFDGTTAIHLKPARRRDSQRKDGTSTDPHGSAKRSVPRSFAQILHWMAIYTAGYWLFVFPDRLRQRLTIADRYHADIMCDPARYRYGGPDWASRCLIRLLPGPDLWFVLDVSAESVRRRKTELPTATIEALRGKYRLVGAGLRNSLVIDAEGSADQVASAATDGVLRFLASRQRS